MCLPVAFLIPAVVGMVLERTLYSRLYGASPLDQVLFTIGIVFASMAMASYFMGAQHQIIQLPPFLGGQFHVFAGFDVGVYRLFLIGFCGVIALFLHFVLMRTRFGSQLRAAVDNARMARGIGINVNRLFAITFAVGSGLAGLAGALGIEILDLDPVFPVKFIIYFLIVVAVGGTGTLGGPLAAALILGIFDVAGKYYMSQIGAFIIYTVMVVMLICASPGALRPERCPLTRLTKRGARHETGKLVQNADAALSRRGRVSAELGGVAAGRVRLLDRPGAAYFLLPRQLVLFSQVAVMGMFALSLDLILGYAGVISLGHAAFFGLGGYTAGILAQHGLGEPLSGLVIGGFAAGCLASPRAFSCCAART